MSDSDSDSDQSQILIIDPDFSLKVHLSALEPKDEKSLDTIEKESTGPEGDKKDGDADENNTKEWVRIIGPELEGKDQYEFVENIGPINMPQDISTPVEYFLLFLTPNIIQMFVRETNKYAWNFLRETELKKMFLDSGYKWEPVTESEMKAFISMVLNMFLIRKPTIKSYWSSSSSQKTPWFPLVMGRDRFELILKFFHMVDCTHLPRTGTDGYDPCARFNPLVEHANLVFRHYYKPHREICVHDSLITGTERKNQFIPNLTNKHRDFNWDVKLYMLFDSVSSYSLGFFVHKGNEDIITEQTDHHLWLAHKVVMTLLRLGSYLRRGYHLFVDKFFTSMPLVHDLAKNCTYLTGTISRNTEELPKGMKVKLQPGEIITYRKGEILATAYRESQKKSVFLISTKNKADTREVRIRQEGIPHDRNAPKTEKKPVTVQDYYEHKVRMNQIDMMHYFYLDEKRTIKYWKSVAFNLLSHMLLNAYILYQEHSTEKIMNRYKFNISVIQALITEYRDIKDDNEDASGAGICHVPNHGEKDCCVCSNRKVPGGRKRSRTMCQMCLKGLHGPCFPKHKC